MSNTTDRVKGKIEEMAGTLQRKVGEVIGNDEMAAKGAAHEVKGEAVQQVAKVSERVKGVAETVVGTVKATVGDAVGNDRLHAEGKIEQIKGKVRQDVNQ